MPDKKEIIEICHKYKTGFLEDILESDFDSIWEYISETNDIEELKSMEYIVPLGMLRYRLRQKLKRS